MTTARTALAHLVAALALGATPRLAAQQPAGTAVASGAVADQFGQPVVGAEVRVVIGDRAIATRTGDGGGYRLDGIAPGTHQLRIRRVGYLPATVPLAVTAGELRERSATLVQLPAAVDPALVQTPDGELAADFAEFTARSARGVGVFVDRAAIDGLRPAAATDVVRAMKGFRLVTHENGSIRLVGAGGDRKCAARVLVDGRPYAAVDGLADFDPEHLGALEAYAPGEAPPPLDAVAGPCGTLVVWLRR